MRRSQWLGRAAAGDRRMTKVYISSTYKDLVQYRAAVAHALRRIGHNVVRMEEYVARDQRTRATCEADVAACDIYVGIFAWRYGHIPEDDNEARRSITELEYRKASGEKVCLVFLLADDAPWPSNLRDAESEQEDRGERIRTLRAELKKSCVGYFSSPDQLATEVIAAVYQHESTMRVQRLDVLEEIRESVGLGPSYLPNIQEKLAAARDAQCVEIRLGPTPWWTTRLHLVAALASDFTRIRQFVFLDEGGRYVAMASPLEVRRALTQRFPDLERAYLASRSAAEPIQDIDQVVMLFPDQLSQTFGGRLEQDVKQNISSLMLSRDLGIELSPEAVEQRGERRLLQSEVLRRSKPFVVVLEDGKLAGLIDRAQMASKIAVQALGEAAL
jgi:Domain of unknown function (DUF4062)